MSLTRMQCLVDRGNLFNKPETVTVDFECWVYAPDDLVNSIGGCGAGIRGGRVEFQGRPITGPSNCGTTLPDIPGLIVQGRLVISGERVNVGLELVVE